MKNRKPLNIILIIAIAVVLFSGCGKKAQPAQEIKESSEYEIQNSEDIPNNSERLNPGVLALVGEEEISANDIGYYIYNNAVIIINKVNRAAGMYEGEGSNSSVNIAEDISKFNWNAVGSDGKTYKKAAAEAAVEDAVNDTVFRQMAEKCGYSVENARNEASKLIDDAISANGENKILTNASLIGISDIEMYKKIYTNISVFEGVAKEFYDNSEKYADDLDILSDFAGNKGVSIQSILIMDDANSNQKFALAEEIADMAKSGNDFTLLMREYNEDSGEDESGYTFPEGEMQSDFESAAFALEIGETSDVINSDYGYYVIKRIAGAYELQNYWRSVADVNIANDAYEAAETEFDKVISSIGAAISG